MIAEWSKFCGWKILEFFLKNPNTSIHIKGLAKKLKISPSTSERYLKLYKKQGLLGEERIANAKQFSLNNEDFLAKELKKIWFLLELKKMRFVEKVVKENPLINSIAIYGGYANGEFSQESDIDFLLINQKKVRLYSFKAFEKRLDKKVEVTQLSIGKWRNLLRKKDSFARSVNKNHLLIYGAKL